MKPYGFVFIFLLAPCLPAVAQKKPNSLYGGERFISDCRAAISDYDSPSKPQIGAAGEHCVGYIEGFAETSLMWQLVASKSPDAQVPMFCLPSKLTDEVIIRQVPIWAIEHPEDANDTALEFLLVMLKARYPCGK
jgi:hypothetical protein